MRHRLVWLVSVRLAVTTLLLGSAVLLQWTAPNTFPANPFFLLIALTFALTVLWVLTLPYASRHPWLVAVQLAADTAGVSSFVFLTGGISSYFALLYALPIIGASMLLSRAAGVWMALLSTGMFGGQVMLQYLASAGRLSEVWIGPTPLLPTERFAQYTVATDVLAFLAIAFLSGTLADGLRRADSRLKQASTAIADLKAFNQHVIDSLTSGLATLDRAGRLMTFNRAAEVITGYAAADVIGRSAADILQLPVEFSALLQRDLDGAQSHRVDISYRRKDGSARELGFGVAHLLTADGRTGFLLSFQDVTEVRRLENEGRRKQRLAALGEMAAGIAHEIRNPLASLVGSIQILRAELTLEQEQARLMDIVLRESERLNDTIRSFLAYARPQCATTTGSRRPWSPTSSGTRLTRTRSGRSSGTWRPTGSAPCRRGARCASPRGSSRPPAAGGASSWRSAIRAWASRRRSSTASSIRSRDASPRAAASVSPSCSGSSRTMKARSRSNPKWARAPRSR
jgi:two-component system sensor histidine kinase PilS (NtrC family)